MATVQRRDSKSSLRSTIADLFSSLSGRLSSAVERLRNDSSDLDDVEQQVQEAEKEQRKEIVSILRSLPQSSQPNPLPLGSAKPELLEAKSRELMAYADSLRQDLEEAGSGHSDADSGRLWHIADALSSRVESLEQLSRAQSSSLVVHESPHLLQIADALSSRVGSLEQLSREQSIRPAAHDSQHLLHIADNLQSRVEALERVSQASPELLAKIGSCSGEDSLDTAGQTDVDQKVMDTNALMRVLEDAEASRNQLSAVARSLASRTDRDEHTKGDLQGRLATALDSALVSGELERLREEIDVTNGSSPVTVVQPYVVTDAQAQEDARTMVAEFASRELAEVQAMLQAQVQAAEAVVESIAAFKSLRDRQSAEDDVQQEVGVSRDGIERAMALHATLHARVMELEARVDTDAGSTDPEQLHDALLARVEALEAETVRRSTMAEERLILKSLDANGAKCAELQSRLASCELEKSMVQTDFDRFKESQRQRFQKLEQALSQDADDARRREIEERLAACESEKLQLKFDFESFQESERQRHRLLEEDVQGKESQVATLIEQLATLQQAMSELEEKRVMPQDLDAILQERRRSEELEVFVNELQLNLQDVTHAKVEQSREQDGLKARVRELTQELDAERAKIDSLQASQRKALTDISITHAAERDDLRAQLARAVRDSIEAKEQIKVLQNSHDIATRDLGNAHEQEQESVKADSVAQARRILELEKGIRKACADQELYEETIAATKREAEDLRRMMETTKTELGSELQRLEAQNLLLRDELKEAQESRSEAVRLQIDSLQDALHKERMEAEAYEKARDEAAVLRTRVRDYEAQLRQSESLLEDRKQRYDRLESQLKREIDTERAKWHQLQASRAKEVNQYIEQLDAEKARRREAEAQSKLLESNIVQPPASEKALQPVPLEMALTTQTISKLRWKLARESDQGLQELMEQVQSEQVCLQKTVHDLMKEVSELKKGTQDFFNAASTSKQFTQVIQNDLNQALVDKKRLEQDIHALKEDHRILEEDHRKLGCQFELLMASSVSKEEYHRLKGALDWHHEQTLGDVNWHHEKIIGDVNSRSPTRLVLDTQQFVISTPGRSRTNSPGGRDSTPRQEQRMIPPPFSSTSSFVPRGFVNRISNAAAVLSSRRADSPRSLSPERVLVPPLKIGTSSVPVPTVTRRAVPTQDFASSSSLLSFTDRPFLPASSRIVQATPPRVSSGGRGFSQTHIFGSSASAPIEAFRASQQQHEAKYFTETVYARSQDSKPLRHTIVSNRPVNVSQHAAPRK